MRSLTVFIISLLVFMVSGYAQQSQEADSLIKPIIDPATLAKSRIAAVAEKEKRRHAARYEAGRIAAEQRMVLEHLTNTAQNIRLYLKNGLDTADVYKNLESVRTSYKILGEGIFVHPGTAQTDRNLSAASVILMQLIKGLTDQKKEVDEHLSVLVAFRNDIDSTLNVPAIYDFPSDSAALNEYLTRIKVVSLQGDPADDELNLQLRSAREMQDQTDFLLFTLRSSFDQIEKYREDLIQWKLRKEFTPLWQPSKNFRPLSEILRYSFEKEKLAFKFYIQENTSRLLGLIVLVILIYAWIHSLRKRYEKQEKVYLLTRHPLLSTLIIAISIYQFFFLHATFIFRICLWVIVASCLLLVLKNFISSYWNRMLRIVSVFFFIACIDNIVLQSSRPERWFMLALSLAGILYGSYILLHKQHHGELKEKQVMLFVRILIFVEVISFFTNIIGWYNISKAFLVSGYVGLWIGICFVWVVRLINEALALSSEMYQHTGRRLFYINFSRVGNRVPFLFNVCLVIGWLVIIGENFYVFKKLGSNMQEALLKERQLGDFSFSVNGIVLFIVITYCSMLLSRIISFFGSESSAGTNSAGASVNPRGSWILLLRIFFISAGLFLAFAASGLPLDKLTIVLGALGVGIGLGLQGLVGNLVSGLILAFERPVNVGDIIELNGRGGVMKSIGFRSSIVTLDDGANLIVPNGDLLNQHMINWSLSENKKKGVIPVSVGYGSDLVKVREILEQVAAENERVLKAPPPVALARRFGPNAVEFELIFWVIHPYDASPALSEIIAAIDQRFRKENIEIPLPRQEVHICPATAPRDKRDEEAD